MFNGRQMTMTQPNPQVTPKAEQRRFSAEPRNRRAYSRYSRRMRARYSTP